MKDAASHRKDMENAVSERKTPQEEEKSARRIGDSTGQEQNPAGHGKCVRCLAEREQEPSENEVRQKTDELDPALQGGVKHNHYGYDAPEHNQDWKTVFAHFGEKEGGERASDQQED